MKKVLIITPYFLPSNLVSVHRTRILCKHLEKYNWKPIILTVNHHDYNGNLDLKLIKLIPETVQIKTVNAIPLKYTKKIGLTDSSIRGLSNLKRTASNIVEKEKIDLVYVTILPGYTALVGKYISDKFNIPFVLDYQDPWVYKRQFPKNILKKSTISYWLSMILEKFIIKSVSGITSVSDGTLDTLRERNLLRNDVLYHVFPIGIDYEDAAVAENFGKNHLNKDINNINLLYLGTITKEMIPTLEILFESVKNVNISNCNIKINMTLIGTSANEEASDKLGIDIIINKYKLNNYVTHISKRISYLDSLKTMKNADVLFLLGTNQPHYTASKIFPYWISNTNIFGIFHQDSDIVKLSENIGGTKLIVYKDYIFEKESLVKKTSNFLSSLLNKEENIFSTRNKKLFDSFESNNLSKEHALFFEKVLNLYKEKNA